MTEGMEHFGGSSSTSQGLEAAASEFRSKVDEAATRLSGAAEQFVSMSESLLMAVEEARQSAERAADARHAVEELQERMARDYGNVSELVRDLQERIGALAVLAKPLSVEPESTPQEPQPLYSGSPGESSW